MSYELQSEIWIGQVTAGLIGVVIGLAIGLLVVVTILTIRDIKGEGKPQEKK
jgi:hypothetical protein